MARSKLKIWRAPLATLQQFLDEGEIGIASETNTFVRRPDGDPTGALVVIGANITHGDDADQVIAINDTFVVGSQSAMLALNGANVGDVCVRTDLGKSFILKVNNPAVLANWVELEVSNGVVTSVNGRTGTVSGLSEVGHTHSMADVPDSTFKVPVRAATIDNLAGVYANGSSGVGATLTASANGVLPVIDGITLAVGQRVLLAAQQAQAQNGIYVVTDMGSTTTKWKLTRAVDADNKDRLASAVVAVDRGAVNGGRLFKTDFQLTWTIGTSAMNWFSLQLDSAFKEPVRAASIDDVPGVYYAGNNGAGATLTGSANGVLPLIDGITLSVGHRVLIMAQRDAKQNGIYVVTSTGSTTTKWELTRATDADGSYRLASAVVAVDYGGTRGGKLFKTDFQISWSVGGSQSRWYEILMDSPFKDAVYAASTVNMAGVYQNGANDDGIGATLTASANGFLSIDGITWSTSKGHRILLANQTDAKQNGIYVVTEQGSDTTKWELTRSPDADTEFKLASAIVAVEQGNANTGKLYKTTFRRSSSARVGYQAVNWYSIILDGPYKDSADIGTVGPLPACAYANGVSGVGATLTASANGSLGAIDGQTPAVGNRILVMHQSSMAQNGLYRIDDVGSATTKWKMTRALDADSVLELANATICVGRGIANGGKMYKSSFSTTGTVGSTAIEFWPIVMDSPFKESVVVATALHLDAVYDNGASGKGASLTASANGLIGASTGSDGKIDGGTMYVGYRVLVMAQNDPRQNGIYVITDLGSATTKWKMVRANDACTPTSLASATVAVDYGIVNGAKMFKTSFRRSHVVGTDHVQWDQINVESPFKMPVNVATTAPLRTTVKNGDGTYSVTSPVVVYNNGSTVTPGVGATITSSVNGYLGKSFLDVNNNRRYEIDGATVGIGTRVLVMSQEDPRQNGIYVVRDLGSETTKWVLTRAMDANTNYRMSNAMVSVEYGSMNRAKVFKTDFYRSMTIGTHNVDWMMVSIDTPFKDSVFLATLANLDADYVASTTVYKGTTYKNSIGARLIGKTNGALPAIDGVTLTESHVGYRILVTCQDDPIYNGIYVLMDAGSATTKWEMARAPDANTPVKLAGATVAVDYGSVNRGKLYKTDFSVYGGSYSIGLNAVNWYEIQLDSVFKMPVTVATAAALPTCVYAAGPTSSNPGIGAELQATTNGALVVDGLTCGLGTRILVKNQAETKHNGIYIVTNAGSTTAPWELTRTGDADTPARLAGAVAPVDRGTVNGGKLFTNVFKTTDTLPTTPGGVTTGGAGMAWYEVITSQTYTSDRNLKEDFKEITGALDKIADLTGYIFKMKQTGQVKAGLVAQEVQEVLPEAAPEIAPGILGVDQAGVLALIVQGINELHVKVMDIEKRLNA